MRTRLGAPIPPRASPLQLLRGSRPPGPHRLGPAGSPGRWWASAAFPGLFFRAPARHTGWLCILHGEAIGEDRGPSPASTVRIEPAACPALFAAGPSLGVPLRALPLCPEQFLLCWPGGLAVLSLTPKGPGDPQRELSTWGTAAANVFLPHAHQHLGPTDPTGGQPVRERVGRGSQEAPPHSWDPQPDLGLPPGMVISDVT